MNESLFFKQMSHFYLLNFLAKTPLFYFKQMNKIFFFSQFQYKIFLKILFIESPTFIPFEFNLNFQEKSLDKQD